MGENSLSSCFYNSQRPSGINAIIMRCLGVFYCYVCFSTHFCVKTTKILKNFILRNYTFIDVRFFLFSKLQLVGEFKLSFDNFTIVPLLFSISVPRDERFKNKFCA